MFLFTALLISFCKKYFGFRPVTFRTVWLKAKTSNEFINNHILSMNLSSLKSLIAELLSSTGASEYVDVIAAIK